MLMALGLFSFASCTSPAEERAEEVEESAEERAEQIEEAGEERADQIEDNADGVEEVETEVVQ